MLRMVFYGRFVNNRTGFVDSGVESVRQQLIDTAKRELTAAINRCIFARGGANPGR